jgi:RNase P subunit RPR2
LIAGEQAAFNVNAAIETADEIENPAPKSKALLAIAREQANTDPETANRKLETAKELVINGLFIGKDAQLFSLATEEANVANKLVITDPFKSAMDTATRIQNQNIKVRALCHIASEQVKTSLKAANKTLNDAKTIATTIPFYNNKAMALLAIASTEVKTNLVAANKTFTDAIAAAQSIPDAHQKSDALQLIAGEQAAFNVEAAIKTAEEIDVPDSQAKALLAIAREQAKTDPETANRQLETAKNLVIDRRFIHKDDQPFSLITNPNIKVRALCDIASEQANTDSNAANETLNDAKNIANKIPFNNNKAMALLAIASTKVKTNSANANQTFNSAIAAAQSIPEPYQKADALRLIASEQAAFDVKAAIETANEIDVSDSQAKALLAIAHSIRLTLTQ